MFRFRFAFYYPYTGNSKQFKKGANMKKKYKDIAKILILPVFSGIALAGCAGFGAFGGNADNTESISSEASQVAYTQTENISDSSSETNASYNGEIPEGFSERDFQTDHSDAVRVTLSDNSSSAEGDGVIIDGNNITFTSAGTYLLSGSLSDGQITVDLPGEEDKIQLVLDGVNVSKNGSAGIYVKNADKVFVTTVSGSENTVTSTGKFVQSDENNVDGAVFSKDDICFNGGGTLTVAAQTGHGIVSKNDLKITSGTYSVDSSGNALQGKDFVGIAGGNISLSAGSDGIESVHLAVYDGDIDISAEDDGINIKENDEDTSPTIILNGGNIDIDSADDSIQTTGDLTLDGSTLSLVAGGGSENAAQHYGDTAFGNMGGWKGMGQGGPAFGGEQDSSGEINYDTDDDDTIGDGSSNKGIKASNIILKKGSVEIDAQDDAVNADHTVSAEGGTYTLTAGDDGIHADESITLNGGAFTIEAWEGLEATVITINDGDINISASDDGINATPKVSNMNCGLEIGGGTITVDMAQGDTDALDSNGFLMINGGTIDLNAQSPFDYDGEESLNSGTVYVNGSQVTELYNQMMGGGQMGGQGRGMF